jgi:hypothetical protein
VLQHLLTGGVPEDQLPGTERLARAIHDAVRDLAAEKQDEALTPIWKATMRLAREKGRRPMVVDVQDAAVEIINSEASIERQQKEVLTKLEGMARGLKMGLAFDVLSEDYRRRLTVALMAIADGVKILLAAVNSPAIKERVKSDARADEAQEKAQIIKEEIAQHHGEKPGSKAKSIK